jgi:hypothetical protein
MACAFAMLPIAVVGDNGGLGAVSVLVFVLGASLLWRPGEPPILLFVFLFHWLQASIAILYGNVEGLSISELMTYEGDHSLAVLLLLIGVAVLAIAMRMGAGPGVGELATRARALAASQPLRFWVALYAVAWVFSTGIALVAPFTGGLRHVVLAISGLKWAAFLLLTVATFAVPGRAKSVWVVIVAVEVVLGLTGYFSTFKDVAFFAAFGLLFGGVRLRLRQLLPLLALAPALLIASLTWTAVKQDYRDFLNQGTGQQVVLVTPGEALSELGFLVGALATEDYLEAGEDMVLRLSYFEYFGVVLDEVPAALPHSRGEIWGESLARPFMPRLFFPGKRVVNDSELTKHYTGLRLAGYEQGTSISLGYMAEAYIDFGTVAMFLPIFGLGWVLGRFYRWQVGRPGESAVYGAAIASFLIIHAAHLETSALKLVPTVVLSVLTGWLLMTFLVPWLVSRGNGARRSSGQLRPAESRLQR